MPKKIERGDKFILVNAVMTYGDKKRYQKDLGVYAVQNKKNDEGTEIKIREYDVNNDKDIVLLQKYITDTSKKGRPSIEDILNEVDEDFGSMYDEAIEFLKKENKLEKSKEEKEGKEGKK